MLLLNSITFWVMNKLHDFTISNKTLKQGGCTYIKSKAVRLDGS